MGASLASRHLTSERIQARAFIETRDRALVNRARAGDSAAMTQIIERYRGFVRLKASSYFLPGAIATHILYLLPAVKKSLLIK